MEDPKIREHMQELFEGFEAEPPAAVWEQVEQKITGHRRRKPILWLVFSAAAAVALILMLVLQEVPEELPASLSDNEGYPPLSPRASAPSKTQVAESTPNTQQIVIRHRDITPTKGRKATVTDTSTDQNNFISQVAGNRPPAIMQPNQPIYGISTPEKGQILLANNVRNENPATIVKPPVRQAIASLPPVSAGSHTNINLNEISMQEVVTLASNRLNRIVDSPLEITHEQIDVNNELVTYELDLKLLKITRKTSRTTKVN